MSGQGEEWSVRGEVWQEACSGATVLHAEDLETEPWQQILLSKPEFVSPAPNCSNSGSETVFNCRPMCLLQDSGSGENPTVESVYVLCLKRKEKSL